MVTLCALRQFNSNCLSNGFLVCLSRPTNDDTVSQTSISERTKNKNKKFENLKIIWQCNSHQIENSNIKISTKNKFSFSILLSVDNQQ